MRLSIALLAFVLAAGSQAHAQTPGRLGFLWWGEPDPRGADEELLAIGRRRGALALRETPGALSGETPSVRLQKAVDAYRALKVPEALTQLESLEHDVRVDGGAGLTRGELVDLHAHLAAAHMALGDEADAWDDLLEVARQAPGRPLDPARFSPRVIEAARRAAQSLPPPAPLKLTATPNDARIVLDGELLGSGHVETTAIPGAHLVRAERAGFRAQGKPLDVGPTGAEATLDLAAVATPSTAELARRLALAGATDGIVAHVVESDGRPTLVLTRVAANGRIEASRRLADDEHLTSVALADAVEALLATGEVRPAHPVPWWKRGWVWGVVGGGVAAALGVGLGVGLTRGSGTDAHVNLGTAR